MLMQLTNDKYFAKSVIISKLDNYNKNYIYIAIILI